MTKQTLLTLLALCIVVSGCSSKITLTMESDGYYPNMRTKDGGTFGDPSESRGQAMRMKTSSTRNNDGKSLYYDKLDNFFNPVRTK